VQAFTSTKVRILTAIARYAEEGDAESQTLTLLALLAYLLYWYNSTPVQILTAMARYAEEGDAESQTLTLLALLVQKYLLY
jgi:hypothetical protein